MLKALRYTAAWVLGAAIARLFFQSLDANDIYFMVCSIILAIIAMIVGFNDTI